MDIKKPTVIIDSWRIKNNIKYMAFKAQKNGVFFRPHFKTHQSIDIGRLFRSEGVTGITVSSLEMADYFAAAEWQDILLAVPLNIREMDGINALAEKVNLSLLIDNHDVLIFLMEKIKHPVSVWLKIDLGYRRAGIDAKDLNSITSLAMEIKMHPVLKFAGLLTHTGDNYYATSEEQIIFRTKQVIAKLNEIKKYLLQFGIEKFGISIGDTPGIKSLDSIDLVDEIRPGNFVFYDLMQYRLGIATESEIAIAVACPVVSKYESRKQILIYGGAIHFSKETLKVAEHIEIYGYLWKPDGKDLGKLDKDGVLIRLTQELGVLQCKAELFERIKVGDIVFIAPVHSCLTADLHDYYLTTNGEWIDRRP